MRRCNDRPAGDHGTGRRSEHRNGVCSDGVDVLRMRISRHLLSIALIFSQLSSCTILTQGRQRNVPALQQLTKNRRDWWHSRRIAPGTRACPPCSSRALQMRAACTKGEIFSRGQKASGLMAKSCMFKSFNTIRYQCHEALQKRSDFYERTCRTERA